MIALSPFRLHFPFLSFFIFYLFVKQNLAAVHNFSQLSVLLTPEKYSECILTTLKTIQPKDTNPFSNTWNAIQNVFKVNNRYFFIMSTIMNIVSVNGKNDYFLKVAALNEFFNDEAIWARNHDSEQVKELATIMSQVSKTLAIMRSSKELGQVIKDTGDLAKMKTAIWIICVLKVMEGFFQITQRMPASDVLVRKFLPVVEEVFMPEAIGESVTTNNPFNIAVRAALQAYYVDRAPYMPYFFQKRIFQYGVLFGLSFVSVVSFIVWIFVRRPNLKQKKI